jgi:hypothetical protein
LLFIYYFGFDLFLIRFFLLKPCLIGAISSDSQAFDSKKVKNESKHSAVSIVSSFEKGKQREAADSLGLSSDDGNHRLAFFSEHAIRRRRQLAQRFGGS